MKKKIENTPTPWFLGKADTGQTEIMGASRYAEGRTHGVAIVSRTPWGKKAEQENEANAAFIVCAVNAHDALIALLERAINRLNSDGGNELFKEEVRAALAKAKGTVQP